MAHSQDIWIKQVWREEVSKERSQLIKVVEKVLNTEEQTVIFSLQGVELNGTVMKGTWRDVWSALRTMARQNIRNIRLEKYHEKAM